MKTVFDEKAAAWIAEIVASCGSKGCDAAERDGAWNAAGIAKHKLEDDVAALV